MLCYRLAITGIIGFVLLGCSEGTKPAPSTVNNATPAESKSSSGDAKPADSEEKVPEQSEPETSEPTELKLEGISFMIPASWKRVQPPSSRIVEAEYMLPHAEGDESDGRLTLMAAGGDQDANIGRWTGEFNQAAGQGPKIETIKIGGAEATWVDIRGEWKGSSFAPIAPRPDYRMLSVIIPFSELNSYYVKLTGPKATVLAREEEFRAMVLSAHIKKQK